MKDMFDMVADVKAKLQYKGPRKNYVVGFDEETHRLIGFLLEESNALDVVTIVGMPGLGKTTVAWKIFREDVIKYEFPILIWVVVSNEFNKRDVLLTILKNFISIDAVSDSSVDNLENLVKEYLEKKKFLLILDDVRTPEVWKEIFKFLPKDNMESRVLITTRNTKVGWHANPNRDPHKLRFLNDGESLMLLKLEVCNYWMDLPAALEQYGKLICTRCNGLPQAIIVIGGILDDKTSTGEGIYSSRTEDEWRLISENPNINIIPEENIFLTCTSELGGNIWCMMHLDHVKTKATIFLTCTDEGADAGESCTEKVFEKAENLRTLVIRGDDISKLVDSRCLEKMLLLEKLKLENFLTFYGRTRGKPLHGLPRALPENIRFLTLANTNLKWSYMSIVGNVPTLEVLKLKHNACRGDCWDSVAGGFHSLESLHINGSDDLILWRVKGDGDPFPSLKTIVIRNCKTLKTVPKEVMRKLEKLELYRVTAFAVKSAKEVKEETTQESGTNCGFKLKVVG